MKCRIRKTYRNHNITRSIQGRADELVIQAKELLSEMISSKVSNLSTAIVWLYVENWYVKGDEEYKYIDDYFP
jgi:hypothetical protein